MRDAPGEPVVRRRLVNCGQMTATSPWPTGGESRGPVATAVSTSPAGSVVVLRGLLEGPPLLRVVAEHDQADPLALRQRDQLAGAGAERRFVHVERVER